MSGSPFRRRGIPPDEVRRIVKRAADLAVLDGGASGPELTEEDVIERLAGLGISADVAARAVAGNGAIAAPRTGDPSGVVREAVIDGMVTPERHEQIAEEIAAAMRRSGRASVVGNKLTWVPNGLAAEPAVTVHSKDGRTRVHYVETAARAPATASLLFLSCLGGMTAGAFALVAGVAVSKAAAISAHQGAPFVFAIAALVAVATIVASMRALHRAQAQRSRARSAFADEVMARVVTAVRDAIDRLPPVRIETDIRDETDEMEESPHEGQLGRRG